MEEKEGPRGKMNVPGHPLSAYSDSREMDKMKPEREALIIDESKIAPGKIIINMQNSSAKNSQFRYA